MVRERERWQAYAVVWEACAVMGKEEKKKRPGKASRDSCVALTGIELSNRCQQMVSPVERGGRVLQLYGGLD